MRGKGCLRKKGPKTLSNSNTNVELSERSLSLSMFVSNEWLPSSSVPRAPPISRGVRGGALLTHRLHRMLQCRVYCPHASSSIAHLQSSFLSSSSSPPSPSISDALRRKRRIADRFERSYWFWEGLERWNRGGIEERGRILMIGLGREGAHIWRRG